MPFDPLNAESKKHQRKSRKERQTNQYVQNLKPTGKRQTISDKVCGGLTLRLSASGERSWSYTGRDCHDRNRTQTIGQYPDTTLKDARNEADQVRQVFAS